MSFYGSMDDARANAKRADHQIDGLEPSATSPVQSGGEGAGGAPLEKGATEFQNARTRPSLSEQSKNLGTSMRRRSN
jgi:hypothetical protein